MNNILGCLILNALGVGFSYFFTLINKKTKNFQSLGTSIFWGFWASMLFTYLLWLFIPTRLDIVCYLTLIIAIFGIGLLIKKEDIRLLLKSDYLITFLLISPFFIIIEYSPSGWDEFSHWLLAPKAFYFERTLLPSTELGKFFSYTPLWTLQSAFFQFFSLSGFNESILYAVRVNFFLLFIFFIKENFRFPLLTMILLTSGILLLFHNLYLPSISVLTIELPIYLLLTSILILVGALEKNQLMNRDNLKVFLFIALISAYMVKKSLIAFLPAGILILYINGYKKEIIYFLIIFSLFYFSWKIKYTGVVNELPYRFHIDPWGEKAKTVYQLLLNRFFDLNFYFILSMFIIFLKKRNVFIFHLISSTIYFLGLSVTYVFWMGEFEANHLASFGRYVAALFIPAYIFALIIITSEVQKIIDAENNKIINSTNIKYLSIFCLSLVIGTYGYNATFLNDTNPFMRQHVVLSKNYKKIKKIYSKIKDGYEVKDKTCMAISQGGNNFQIYALSLAACGELKSISGGSFGPVKLSHQSVVVENDKEKEFIKQLQKYDLIIILDSNNWLQRILLEATNQRTDNLQDFALIKKEKNYELLRI